LIAKAGGPRFADEEVGGDTGEAGNSELEEEEE
jgi:hypothetical protein